MSLLNSVFQFTVSPWELVLRGSLIYWFLFLLFRFVLRRDSGSIGLADILVIVLIADAAQNGMAGEYKSVGEAFVLIGTIAGWNYWIDWMAFRFPWFARFAEARVITLVKHGRLLRENMRREMLTEEDIQSQLRQAGVEDLRSAKRVTLEPDGHLSVIRYSQEESRKRNQRTQPGAG
jgi:uncharacterized membrane protein YcaP (DUF421 family)